jgi:hypothetical protein
MESKRVCVSSMALSRPVPGVSLSLRLHACQQASSTWMACGWHVDGMWMACGWHDGLRHGSATNIRKLHFCTMHQAALVACSHQTLLAHSDRLGRVRLKLVYVSHCLPRSVCWYTFLLTTVRVALIVVTLSCSPQVPGWYAGFCAECRSLFSRSSLSLLVNLHFPTHSKFLQPLECAVLPLKCPRHYKSRT